MRSWIFFLGVTTFWLVMNGLLYRSQWAGHSGFGSSVPVEAVWDKILTAPDNSSLDIYDHDEKIGFGRWGAGTAESPLISSKVLSTDYRPGGVAPKLTGYGLSFEGSAQIRASNHVRFQTSLALDTNKVWQDFRFRASLRPNAWELHASAANQTVSLKVNEGGESWDRTLKFSELQDPQALLGDLADPLTLSFLGLDRSLPGGLGAAMRWEAHEDRVAFAQSKLRVYRLETFFLGQRIEVIVSRIGEILWVNLPFNLSLRNQAISPYNN
jgi:hypothetical protein